MGRKTKRLLSKFRESLPWIVTTAAAVLSASLAANATDKSISVLLSGHKAEFSWLDFIYIAIFMLLAYQFYRDRKKLFPPRTKLLLKPAAEKRKHLIAFLSYLPWVSKQSNGIPDGLKLAFKTLEQDIEIIASHKAKTGFRWSWEMLLKAINHHLGKLETLTLICSKQSLPQLNLFLTICFNYEQLKDKEFYVLAQTENRHGLFRLSSINEVKSLQKELDGYDFEAFDEIVEAMSHLLREFKERDFTGEKHHN